MISRAMSTGYAIDLIHVYKQYSVKVKINFIHVQRSHSVSPIGHGTATFYKLK